LYFILVSTIYVTYEHCSFAKQHVKVFAASTQAVQTSNPWCKIPWTYYYTVSLQNRARIFWPITFTNIDQYQCHLIELFLQHFLIINLKNYSHSRVPAATVAMATSALVQTNICAITAHRPIVHVPPSSICARPHATSTSWNSTWLIYGQTLGRQSLMGPSMSGESDFRPVFVWKDTISDMSCKSFLFLLTFLPSNLQVL